MDMNDDSALVIDVGSGDKKALGILVEKYKKLAFQTALGLVGMQITPSAHPEVKKVKWINPLLADPVPANIGTLQEGRYPFKMGLYYYTIADRTDLASGFLSFMAGNQGQRLVADNGFLPAMIPVRIVNLSPYGDQK